MPVVVVAQRTGASPRSLPRWLSQRLVARPSAADASLGFAVPTLDPAPETGGIAGAWSTKPVYQTKLVLRRRKTA